MGFRSYIRQFLDAILYFSVLFLWVSEVTLGSFWAVPRGFAAGSGSILGVAACDRSSRSRSSSSSRRKRRKQEEKVAKTIFFYGFQKLH